MVKILIVFFVAQLVNVVLSTIKSVITIKGGKNLAALLNAISYAFNTIVIKSLVSVDIWVALAITFTTNLVGVYFGLWVLEKMRKDQVWKITVTLNKDDFTAFTEELKTNEISYINYRVSMGQYKVIDIFSRNKETSRKLKTLFKQFSVRYTISANSATL